MNVQLLIEKIGNLDKLYGEKFYVALDDILDLVKQLDEPGKVTVPQFVADWIKKYDLREETLGKQSVFDVFDNLENDSKNGYYKDVKRWIDDNRDLFARAWLDGYEVEKEKRYLVRIKGVEEDNAFLNYYAPRNEWFMDSGCDMKDIRAFHTRKELEDADFGWVFDCPGIEIEEVEE
nr:MAG TPA: Protein of unknown function (DUF1642) [Caudoviricetes sp.]